MSKQFLGDRVDVLEDTVDTLVGKTGLATTGKAGIVTLANAIAQGDTSNVPTADAVYQAIRQVIREEIASSSSRTLNLSNDPTDGGECYVMYTTATPASVQPTSGNNVTIQPITSRFVPNTNGSTSHYFHVFIRMDLLPNIAYNQQVRCITLEEKRSSNSNSATQSSFVNGWIPTGYQVVTNNSIPTNTIEWNVGDTYTYNGISYRHAYCSISGVLMNTKGTYRVRVDV